MTSECIYPAQFSPKIFSLDLHIEFLTHFYTFRIWFLNLTFLPGTLDFFLWGLTPYQLPSPSVFFTRVKEPAAQARNPELISNLSLSFMFSPINPSASHVHKNENFLFFYFLTRLPLLALAKHLLQQLPQWFPLFFSYPSNFPPHGIKSDF